MGGDAAPTDASEFQIEPKQNRIIARPVEDLAAFHMEQEVAHPARHFQAGPKAWREVVGVCAKPVVKAIGLCGNAEIGRYFHSGQISYAAINPRLSSFRIT